MTQEDKELLLKDLCARSPYGVVADCLGEYVKIKYVDPYSGMLYISRYTRTTWEIVKCIKPYLRLMSSMTEKEKKEYDSFLFDNLEKEDVIGYEDKAFGVDVIMRYRSWEVVQWLLEHHLDFNGLIDIGLALEAPEGLYRIK